RKLIDVYEGGAEVSLEKAAVQVREATGAPLTDEQLAPAKKRAIIVRMLRNLEGIARSAEDVPALLRYTEAVLALNPDAGEDRMLRAVLNYQLGRREAAIRDADWLLEHHPEGVDQRQVQEFRRILDRPQ
ncbi:MAG TPA: tetratricopeptide repeat protein, partial [Planctomycetaceae bacterium]|nr:tetratricopeptide repeat protein [Planctomycetaceae bacterium]